MLLFAELLPQKLILTGQNLFRLTKLVKQHPVQNLFMPASASVCLNVVQIFDKKPATLQIFESLSKSLCRFFEEMRGNTHENLLTLLHGEMDRQFQLHVIP